MTIGLGIVGCGMIADFHARSVSEMPGIQLIGCVDQLDGAANGFADRHGCRRYRDLHEMLDDSGIQAVAICTPSGAHLESAMAAAGAGKHVIVEKPLEVTLERCDQIIDACRRNSVVLSTIFQSRFHQSSQLLKQAVDQGRFGTLSLANAYVKWYRSQEYYDSGAWRGTWKLDGGGALMNQAIHNVDLLCWMMGPVRSVTAKTATLAHERIEVEDTVVASLAFENGALGSIEATTAAYPGQPKQIQIYGSHGSAAIDDETISLWQFAEPRPSDAQILEQLNSAESAGGGASDPASISHEAHAKQYADIVRAIENNSTPLVDGHQGRRSVEVVLAIYEAARNGVPVIINH